MEGSFFFALVFIILYQRSLASVTMKVLYVGSLGVQSTSLYRMLALRELGHLVHSIDTDLFMPKGIELTIQFRLGFGRHMNALNKKLMTEAVSFMPDLIWVDKGIFLKANTLNALKKQTLAKIVHLNPDDPFGEFTTGWRLFLRALPFYDLHFVPRQENILEYKRAGGQHVVEYDRSFSTLVHYPIIGNDLDRKFLCDVGFVGSFAKERAEAIAFLIDNGIQVAIYGSGWQKLGKDKRFNGLLKGAVIGKDYASALSGMKIALHFLRKENRDVQDSRTFEIPACGAFMVAERSDKHEALFAENTECVFFDSHEELLEKVRYYLTHDRDRIAIAKAGLERSHRSGYDHVSRLRGMFDLVEKKLFIR